MTQYGTRLCIIDDPLPVERISMQALTGGDTYYARNLVHNTVDCTQCGVVFAHDTREKYCSKCRRHGLRVLKWWRRCKDRKRLIERIMALNVMSSSLDVSEMGINENVLSFL